MKHHPLDDAFDVDTSNMLSDDSIIEIPDDPNLDTIITFALRAYKEQMEDIVLIEPKNRIRYLEIAERFLEEAKDAMYKKEQIRIAREKLLNSKKVDPSDVQKTNTNNNISKKDLLKKLKEEAIKSPTDGG